MTSAPGSVPHPGSSEHDFWSVMVNAARTQAGQRLCNGVVSSSASVPSRRQTAQRSRTRSTETAGSTAAARSTPGEPLPHHNTRAHHRRMDHRRRGADGR